MAVAADQETFDAVLMCFRRELLHYRIDLLLKRQQLRCCLGASLQSKVRAMALHCCSSSAVRPSSSAKVGTSPRSIPESLMAL